MVAMSRPHIAAFALLLSSLSMAQPHKIPVSVLRTGDDKVGSLFVAALNREVSRSTIYAPTPREGNEKGLRFYIELATVTVGDGHDTSAVSVVVEDMGLPNSFPVATKWYHKILLVNSKTSDALARELVQDIEAHWCNTIRNSVGNCPKELLPPIYP